MKTIRLQNILLFLTCFSVLPSVAKSSTNLKPRLVVMTDIGDCDVEPDDMESAVRLLSYADMFEIEGIMTTVGWNCDPYPESWAQFLYKVVDAYGKDVKNLMKRSHQNDFQSIAKENGKQEIGYWPSYEYIRSRCMSGSHRAGIGVIGKYNDSEGSDFLIKLADEDDDRPLWIATWGSGNTLAQAIWKVKQTRTPEQLREFLRKFRVYTITDQDMKFDMRMNMAYSSHQWLRKEFEDDLLFIWDEGTWQLHCGLGRDNWQIYQTEVQGHGELGKVYPNFKYGVEGDTPSFLYVIPNGLNDPEHPEQAGWSGYHRFSICPDSLTFAWTSWEEPTKSITEGYKRRFYSDELNDFCARIEWAETGRGNTNPIIYINGEHSNKPIELNVNAGETLTIDASKTIDSEGDELAFKWWIQPEVSSYKKSLRINDDTKEKISISIPEDAIGKCIHLICEVHDKGVHSLVSYARIIIRC